MKHDESGWSSQQLDRKRVLRESLAIPTELTMGWAMGSQLLSDTA